MQIMNIVIIFVCGLFIGCILTNIIRRIRAIGTLCVELTDPDGPYIFLELDKGDAYQLAKQKCVLMQVRLKGYIPHK